MGRRRRWTSRSACGGRQVVIFWLGLVQFCEVWDAGHGSDASGNDWFLPLRAALEGGAEALEESLERFHDTAFIFGVYDYFTTWPFWGVS